jgi:hypothetical protein
MGKWRGFSLRFAFCCSLVGAWGPRKGGEPTTFVSRDIRNCEGADQPLAEAKKLRRRSGVEHGFPIAREVSAVWSRRRVPTAVGRPQGTFEVWRREVHSARRARDIALPEAISRSSSWTRFAFPTAASVRSKAASPRTDMARARARERRLLLSELRHPRKSLVALMPISRRLALCRK